MTVFEKIEKQQKGREDTAVWMVGEQLKDICRSDPHCAEIVAQDLENKDMSLDKAEKKIKAYADTHRKGNCAVVPPHVAEGIIREFYGLPAQSTTVLSLHVPAEKVKAETDPGAFSLDDFLSL